MHTVYSDGRDSVAGMVHAARALGYAYMAITDHSPTARASRVLTLERIAEQAGEIAAVRALVPDITILHGIECDIQEDGSLDVPDARAGAPRHRAGVAAREPWPLAGAPPAALRARDAASTRQRDHPPGQPLARPSARLRARVRASVRARGAHGNRCRDRRRAGPPRPRCAAGRDGRGHRRTDAGRQRLPHGRPAGPTDAVRRRAGATGGDHESPGAQHPRRVGHPRLRGRQARRARRGRRELDIRRDERLRTSKEDPCPPDARSCSRASP